MKYTFYTPLNLSLLFILIAPNGETEGSVDIMVHQPFYVEYGSNLTLTCVSDNGRQLEWLQTTHDNGYQMELINPVIGGNFITRYTIEKPSNGVESTLIKMGMVLNDRGVYMCRDTVRDNSFALEATVIYIATDNVIAEPESEVYLYCSIQGFSSNLPTIDYQWYYSEETIVTSHKYDLVYKDGVSQLSINQPEHDDGGNYTCSFSLQTTKGPVTFSKNVYLDTRQLKTTSAASSVLSQSVAFVLIVITITTTLFLCFDSGRF